MDLAIRRDIRQLALDARKVRRELDMLAQDHKILARERENNDPANVIDHLKRLEFDVSIIQADCVFIGRAQQEDSAWQVLHSLHRAFATLNILFNDLKKMRTELKKAYIYSADMKQLEIDWDRFSKTIGQIEQHLCRRDDLFEVSNVLGLGQGGGRDVCFCTTG